MTAERFTLAIQARTGATRLPRKMSLPFFRDETILDVILERLLAAFDRQSIVVATSVSDDDCAIVDIARRHDVRSARGSEDDVLGRMLQAIGPSSVQFVVRICADNPFLRTEFIEDLLDLAFRTQCDYASFALPDGTPTILSHLGMFAEVVSYPTLKQIERTATAQRHREHMTSHILDHPGEYRRAFLPVPTTLTDLPSLRLTVDTSVDFAICQRLYASLAAQYGRAFTVEQLVATVKETPELSEEMARQIATNEKS